MRVLRYASALAFALPLASQTPFAPDVNSRISGLFSFRMRSTGGLFEDDFDVMLDPARMGEIGGKRVYTAFANIFGDERLLEPQDDDYFTFGSNGKAAGGDGGFVYARKGFDTPLLNLAGDTGRTEFDSTRRWDNNGDGDPDIESRSSGWQEASRSDGSNVGYVGYGHAMGKGSFGLYYLRLSNTGIFRPAGDPLNPAGNFARHVAESSLVTNALLMTEEDTGFSETTSYSSLDLFGLSTWFAMGEAARLGLLIGYGLDHGGTNENSSWNLMHDENPTGPDTNLITRVGAVSGAADASGSDIVARLAWTSVKDSVATTWVSASYVRRSLSIASGAKRGDWSVTDTTITLPTGTFRSYTSDSSTYDLTGNTGADVFDFSMRKITPLNDRVAFAWGVGVGLGRGDSVVQRDGDRRVIVDYNDGDDEVLDPDDFHRVGTGNGRYEDAISHSRTDFYAPVGMEFRPITDNRLVLRVGAVHVSTRIDSASTSRLISGTPMHWVETRGDSSVSEWTDNWAAGGATNARTSRISNTFFYYGLGFGVTEVLQVDVMYFADLTYLGTWRFSFVLTF